ncbi:hypothetical protein DENIS_3927 [Desulfonema ishimotonii]|uniref:Uncharacterized protein n=1 Tax=Desulfonema ishimotonii TaxID=45657 RepID=A0A401G180_9BACT|nr:TMEM43 family protein [Desulfonema ishimotonii]GBC62943.1 hypothetical protein DENIS_3927 [Desulfonema ishimotonii]
MLSKRHKKERKRGKFIFGLLICGLAMLLLFWNEGRAVRTAKSLREGADTVRTISADLPDPANEGKLVHLTGQAVAPDAALPDPELKLRFSDVIVVRREAEMYQWKGLDKSKATDEYREYKTVWKEKPIDSDNFSPDHQNPRFLIDNKRIVPDGVRIGSFRLADTLTQNLTAEEKILLGDAHLSRLPDAVRQKAMLYQGGLYIAHRGQPDPQTPQIGDMRIRFYGAPPQVVSVIARQQGDSLVSYQADAGDAIAILKPGSLSAESLFADETVVNSILTWFIRFFGFIFAGLGIRLMAASLTASGSGRIGALISGWGVNLFTGMAAAALSLATVSVAWLIHRPLTGAGMLAAVVAVIFGARKYLARKAARDRDKNLNADILRLARDKGGKLTVVEVMMALRLDADPAKNALDAFVHQGVAQIEVSESGVLVYAFYDIRHLDEKSSAKGVLDA